MHTYRVWYGDGSAVLINAHTADDARQLALEQATADGYEGLSVAQVEQLN